MRQENGEREGEGEEKDMKREDEGEWEKGEEWKMREVCKHSL
jgi:hypothetical protein